MVGRDVERQSNPRLELYDDFQVFCALLGSSPAERYEVAWEREAADELHQAFILALEGGNVPHESADRWIRLRQLVRGLSKRERPIHQNSGPVRRGADKLIDELRDYAYPLPTRCAKRRAIEDAIDLIRRFCVPGMHIAHRLKHGHSIIGLLGSVGVWVSLTALLPTAGILPFSPRRALAVSQLRKPDGSDPDAA